MKKIIFTIAILITACTGILANTITVTNNNESGAGSLRQTIIDANDGDVVVFDQPYTIYLTSPIALGDKNITIEGNVNGELVKLDGNFLDEDKDWIDDDGVFTNLLLVISSGDYTVNINNMVIQNGSVSDDDWGGAWGGTDMYFGGGIYIDLTEGGSLTMTGCSIQDNVLSQMDEGYDGVNQVYLRGAGIYSVNGGSFVDCTIKNNVCIAKNSYQCNMSGGGAYIYEGGSFTNCFIAGNKILFLPINDQNFYYGSGAGLDLFEKADVINCLIIGNCIKNLSDDYRGYFNQVVAGGIKALNAKVYNTTVAGNSIENIYELTDQDQVGSGGAFLTYRTNASDEYSDHCDYQNNIFYANYSSSGKLNDGGSVSKFTKYSAFPISDDYAEWDFDVTNIFLDENPFFEAPSAGDDGKWGTDDDNYGDLRLKQSSLCIDAGNPDETQFDVLSTDFYGRQRIANGIIDMGAVESVNIDYTFSLSGSIWEGIDKSTSGKVYAFDINNTGEYAAVCNWDEDGTFEFKYLASGEYYLYAVPTNSQAYQETYYGDETSIQSAISIAVDDIIYDVDIHLVEALSTSNNNITSMSIQLFPNPASSYLNIKCKNEIEKVIIYNSFGKIETSYLGNVNQLNIDELRNGVYIISVFLENETKNLQFVKR